MGELAGPELARRNLLLAALPDPVLERVLAAVEPVDLPAGTIVCAQHARIDRFYFLTSGLASMLYRTEDGHTAEVSVIGPEGGLGVSLFMGRARMPSEIVMQVPGSALAMDADALLREFARGGALQRYLLRFAQVLMVQMAQTVVCNRHHSVRLQLCRWILLTIDRLGDSELGMTQETIAHMLGVRRAGVTEAATRLQQAELIRYRRGRITLTDRQGLEQAACECYRVIRAEYDSYVESLAEYADTA